MTFHYQDRRSQHWFHGLCKHDPPALDVGDFHEEKTALSAVGTDRPHWSTARCGPTMNKLKTIKAWKTRLLRHLKTLKYFFETALLWIGGHCLYCQVSYTAGLKAEPKRPKLYVVEDRDHYVTKISLDKIAHYGPCHNIPESSAY